MWLRKIERIKKLMKLLSTTRGCERETCTRRESGKRAGRRLCVEGTGRSLRKAGGWGANSNNSDPGREHRGR